MGGVALAPHLPSCAQTAAATAATAAAAAAAGAAATSTAAAAAAAPAAALSLSNPFPTAAFLRASLGPYRPYRAFYQQQQQQRQQLGAQCCFSLTVPEDTRRRRSRKGSSRNPLKRLLKIPRGGWKQQASNTSSTSSSNKNNSSSSSSSRDSAQKPRFLTFRGYAGEAAVEQQQQHTGAAATAAAAAAAMERPPIVDIGANLCDPMYEGTYFDKHKHPPDLQEVLRRAEAGGVGQIILTTGSLEEYRINLKLAETFDPECRRLFTTIGVHPTRCNEFAAAASCSSSSNSSSTSSSDSSSSSSSSEAFAAFAAKLEEGGLLISSYPESHQHYLFELQQQLQQQQQQRQQQQQQLQQQQQRIVAVGEIGLDYDRLRFCDAATQKQCFELQLGLSYTSGLPLFLHMRNAADDFLAILKKNEKLWRAAGGVAHSFTGTAEEARLLLDAGLYIGINGCSLKTEENLEVKAQIDGVKPEKWKADSQVKGRNEPCNIWAVGEVTRQLAAPGVSEADFYNQ
ncbi:hypothetical protein Efla_002584 [Eimeria flavescens]